MPAHNKNLPVIIRAVRTPFLDSAGAYSPLMSYELGAAAIAGLVERTHIDGSKVDVVAMGTVLHEVETTNVARESMLQAGLPSTIPAYTVSMAGLSPNVALTTVCDMIALGRIDMGIAGGTETFSDVPIRLSPYLRRAAMKVHQDRSPSNVLQLFKDMRPRDLVPAPPTGTDFTTGKTMGQCAEAMVQKFGVRREDCDALTLRSHQLAVKAWAESRYTDDIVPVQVPGLQNPVTQDDTPRADSSLKKLARLKPVFNKRTGVITAGTSSRYTDGAGAILLTSLDAANKQGLVPQAVVRDYALAGVTDLATEMLLGPAMAIPKLLARNNLTLNDIDVWELHEAFAAQILINLSCLADKHFARDYFGLDAPLGHIPLDKLNTWGGSLAMGNPFAATGVRLIGTAARRLQMESKRYAIVSSCAGGGLGAAILLENADFLR